MRPRNRGNSHSQHTHTYNSYVRIFRGDVPYRINCSIGFDCNNAIGYLFLHKPTANSPTFCEFACFKMTLFPSISLSHRFFYALWCIPSNSKQQQQKQQWKKYRKLLLSHLRLAECLTHGSFNITFSSLVFNETLPLPSY